MAMEEHLPRHDKTLLAVQLEATENYFKKATEVAVVAFWEPDS